MGLKPETKTSERESIMLVSTICNVANRQNPEVLVKVEARSEELPLQHEANAPGRSVINNRGFAWVGNIMVEVVRRGPVNTRVRRSFKDNGNSYLVKTADILAYSHVDARE